MARRMTGLGNELEGHEYGQWQTPRGSVTAWVLPPNLLVSRADGHIDADLVEHIVEAGNEVIARYGSLVAFHDWQRITSYESQARTRLTGWGDQIRADVGNVHILVGSKLVRMGVSVASIILGNMLVAYDSRSRFEAAFHDARHPQSTGGSPK